MMALAPIALASLIILSSACSRACHQLGVLPDFAANQQSQKRDDVATDVPCSNGVALR